MGSPASIELDEIGRHIVSFPDFGWGATDGTTLDEALDEAADVLRKLIAATMRDGAKLPDPSLPFCLKRPRPALSTFRAEGPRDAIPPEVAANLLMPGASEHPGDVVVPDALCSAFAEQTVILDAKVLPTHVIV